MTKINIVGFSSSSSTMTISIDTQNVATSSSPAVYGIRDFEVFTY